MTSWTRHEARVREKELEAKGSMRAKGRKEAGRKRRGAKERRRARRTRTSERREGRKKGPGDGQETSSCRTWKMVINKSAGEPLKSRTSEVTAMVGRVESQSSRRLTAAGGKEAGARKAYRNENWTVSGVARTQE